MRRAESPLPGNCFRPKCESLRSRLCNAAQRWNYARESLLLLLSFLCVAVPGRGQERTLLGKVVPLPNTVVDVFAPATGRIISAKAEPFLVGDLVKEGDPLAIIEHRYTLHDIAHAATVRWDMLKVVIETRRKALESHIAREKAERLMELGSVSGQQVLELQAAEQVAQSEYEKQKALLEYQDAQVQGTELVRRPIYAPISGDISLANFTQGQVINEGYLLYRIVNMKEVGVSARVPESEYSSWPPDTRVRIRFDTLPGKVFTGQIEVSPPLVDMTSRTRDVILRVKNPDEYLRFGMIGQVELIGP
ncbi:MAG: efflux RND transporter periplasmic adaptor subunit [Acidobacteria bacterium]|nr:efflux RND transporter periplasmic adaptor subunit [Acidobacteriota bacterium]